MWKNYIIGVVLSVATLLVFFKQASPGQIWQAFEQVNPWMLIPVTAVYLSSFVLRALRWRYLMRPVAEVGFMPLLSALMIGFLGNNILPAHLGEVIRAVVLGRDAKVSASSAMATVVMERLFDGLTILLLLGVVLMVMDVPHWVHMGGWAGLGFFGGIMLLLQAFRWQRQRSMRLLAFLLRPLPERFSTRMLGMTESFVDGLAVTKASDLAFISAYSLVLWVTLSFCAWLLMKAFGLEQSFIIAVFLEVLVALALIIPAAPGFVGTFHVGAQIALVMAGVAAQLAGSFAMLLWLIHFIPTTLVGLYFLKRSGMRWTNLTNYSQKKTL